MNVPAEGETDVSSTAGHRRMIPFSARENRCHRHSQTVRSSVKTGTFASSRPQAKQEKGFARANERQRGNHRSNGNHARSAAIARACQPAKGATSVPWLLCKSERLSFSTRRERFGIKPPAMICRFPLLPRSSCNGRRTRSFAASLACESGKDCGRRCARPARIKKSDPGACCQGRIFCCGYASSSSPASSKSASVAGGMGALSVK